MLLFPSYHRAEGALKSDDNISFTNFDCSNIVSVVFDGSYHFDTRFFLFSIVRMLYLCSNRIFYSTFGAERLRIAGTRSICSEFRTSFKALLNRAENQVGDDVVLTRPLPNIWPVILRCFKNSLIDPLHS